MKKLLIITYYWPPSGGSGVQRWFKFVKYLTKKNFYCLVYTPENPEMPVIDPSFEKDIPTQNFECIKTKIFEPYSFYRLFTGRSSKERITVAFLSETKTSTGFREKVSKWIRSNLFIPDARMFWIRPSLRFLSNYLKTQSVDAMISTGPPHSMHLIAYGLKKKFPNIPWIADFRDPWSTIYFFNHLNLTSWALQQHKKLERQVVQQADVILSVSPVITEELKRLDASHPEKFYTLTNGFDKDDFPAPETSNDTMSCTITYAGLIPPNQNPRVLWQAIKELNANHLLPSSFKVQLIGKADVCVWEDIQKYGISSFVVKTDYLPHSEVLKREQESGALLLVVYNAPNNKGIVTGKLFEYLALQKPILAIGPTDGEAAKIIHNCSAGIMVEYDDVEGMKQALLNFLNHKLPSPKLSDVQQYSREALTDALIDILNKIMRNNSE